MGGLQETVCASRSDPPILGTISKTARSQPELSYNHFQECQRQTPHNQYYADKLEGDRLVILYQSFLAL